MDRQESASFLQSRKLSFPQNSNLVVGEEMTGLTTQIGRSGSWWA